MWDISRAWSAPFLFQMWLAPMLEHACKAAAWRFWMVAKAKMPHWLRDRHGQETVMVQWHTIEWRHVKCLVNCSWNHEEPVGPVLGNLVLAMPAMHMWQIPGSQWMWTDFYVSCDAHLLWPLCRYIQWVLMGLICPAWDRRWSKYSV